MIEYVILAILQGLFEWLPISSSGQVMIFSTNFLGIPPEEAYSLSIWLHLGTTLAVIIKMRKDYIQILKSLLPSHFKSTDANRKKRNWLIYATIGTVITGVPLYFIFKIAVLGNFSANQGDILTMIISGFLVITGVVLLIFKKRYGKKEIDSSESRTIFKDSIISGFFQGVAILPGISRSGFTVSSILLENYKQNQALKLSFLISVPVALGSIAVDIIFGEGSVFGNLDILTIGVVTLVSFVIGYLSMEFLLRISQKVDFSYFCIFYGIISFVIIVPIMLMA